MRTTGWRHLRSDLHASQTVMHGLSQAWGPSDSIVHACCHDKACACLRPAQEAAALTLPGAGAAAAARSPSAQPRHPLSAYLRLSAEATGARPRGSSLPVAPRHACMHAQNGKAKARNPAAGWTSWYTAYSDYHQNLCVTPCCAFCAKAVEGTGMSWSPRTIPWGTAPPAAPWWP